MRRGQAMIETVLAVLIVTSTFLFLFRLSRLMTEKVLVQHAAMRVARARAVGLNEFMCLKSARVAVIPVAGDRLWPVGEDAIGSAEELGRLGVYMQAPTPAIARGVLDYEGWSRLRVEAGDGTGAEVRFGDLTGRAGIERNFSDYMNNSGL